MSNDVSRCRRIWSALYRFADIKQPEVRWSLVVSAFLEVLLILINFYANFSLYTDDLCSLLQCLIGALVSLIGVAVAGVAIVISLFSREQIAIIEDIKAGAFKVLLEDFKWLALISGLDTAVLVGMLLIIKTPFPLVPAYLLYSISFLLIYVFFYLLFYCYALIGNCIRLYAIRNTIEEISMQTKSVPVSALEFQIDFLVSELLKHDKSEAKKFYSKIITLAESSKSDNKKEVLKYLKDRYASYIQND